jgi:hypothetical protein
MTPVSPIPLEVLCWIEKLNGRERNEQESFAKMIHVGYDLSQRTT